MDNKHVKLIEIIDKNIDVLINILNLSSKKCKISLNNIHVSNKKNIIELLKIGHIEKNKSFFNVKYNSNAEYYLNLIFDEIKDILSYNLFNIHKINYKHFSTLNITIEIDYTTCKQNKELIKNINDTIISKYIEISYNKNNYVITFNINLIINDLFNEVIS